MFDGRLRSVKIHIHWIVLLVFILVCVAASIAHFFIDPVCYPKLSSFSGGLAAAFLVASLQFGLQIHEQIRTAMFRRHGVLNIIDERRDTKLYEDLIRSAKSNSEIQVLGVTCSRLLTDFADFREEKTQALIGAMQRQVAVKVLAAKVGQLAESDRSKIIGITIPLANKLKKEFPDNFHIKYYDEPASHSVFGAGVKCIVGPVFKSKDSRNTPSIIFDRQGDFVRPYLVEFDRLWEAADESPE